MSTIVLERRLNISIRIHGALVNPTRKTVEEMRVA